MKNPNPTIKPPFGSYINPEHPLSQGLVFAFLFNEGQGTRVNGLLDVNGVFQGSPTWCSEGINIGGEANSIWLKDSNVLGHLNNATIMVDGYYPGGQSSQKFAYSENRSDGTSWIVYFTKDDFPSFGILVSNSWKLAKSSQATSGKHVVAGVLSHAKGMSLYIDGELEATNNNTLPTDDVDINTWIGRYEGDNEDWPGEIYWCYGWGEDFSANNVEWIKAEPYCFINWPGHRFIFDYGRLQGEL